MPARTIWIEAPHLMCAKYEGKITADDVTRIMDECLPLVEDRPMFFLIDLNNAMLFDVNLLQHTSLIKLIRHPNTVFFAMIGVNRILRTGVQLIRPRALKFFEDEATAIAFLREQRTAYLTKQVEKAADSSPRGA